ncbi:MAG: hypothetical protein HZB29_00620 [Nitrospinae bacterium]|nr:hypothetical protein [Nitrospinota bacterium]
MVVKAKNSLACRHCGGAMIDRFDELTCVMCGRPYAHVCDNCRNLETEKQVVGASRKQGRKASAA